MSTVDNIKNKDDFMYANQFHWFTGVIEDIVDPLQRGRYRVRCFGYHTERKDYIDPSALPWAHVMMPITSASQSGVGQSPTGLLRGTWVVGFFRDGATAQDPIIMGSIPSITPSVDYGYGFCDPIEQYPYASKVDHPDMPEEALTDAPQIYTDSFSYKKKEEHRKLTPVPICFDGAWELPPVEDIIRVEYPKNHVQAWEREVPLEKVPVNIVESTGILEETPVVFEGSEGIDPPKEMHVQEFDVTPDWERISTMHKTGTYKEWTPKGEDTTVIVDKEYRVVVDNQHINVKKDHTITIEEDCHRFIYGDEYVHVRGNRIELIEGNLIQTVQGNVIEAYLSNHIKVILQTKIEAIIAAYIQAVGAASIRATGAASLELVGLAKVTGIGGSNLITIGGNQTKTTGGNQYKNIGGSNIITIAGNQFNTMGGDLVTEVGGSSKEVITGEKGTASGGDHLVSSAGLLRLMGTNINLIGESIVNVSPSTRCTGNLGAEAFGSKRAYILSLEILKPPKAAGQTMIVP